MNFFDYSWRDLTRVWLSASIKMKSFLLVVSLLAIYSANCEVFFEEKFLDGKYMLTMFVLRSIRLPDTGNPRV